MLLADQILGRDYPWSALDAPERLARGRRSEGFEHETTCPGRTGSVPVAGPDDRTRLDSLPPGQARRIEIGGQPVLVYRDEDGSLQALGGKCSHMGCALRWNGAETRWDCDCHGSRFAADGEQATRFA